MFSTITFGWVQRRGGWRVLRITDASSLPLQRWAAVFLFLFSAIIPLDGFGENEKSPGNSATILQQFSQAARQGDPVAQTNLGSLYLNGVGVRRDFSRAFYWFQQAANQGEGLAQFNLGVLYQEGRGVTLDGNKAAYWFKNVALQPNRGEQFNPAIKGWAELKLGFIYYEGRGVPKDYREALSWFQKAAERGLVIAQEMLGRMYDEALGNKRDEKRAFMWYEQAARQGSTIAEKALERLSKKLTPQQQTIARQLKPKLQAVASSEQSPPPVSAPMPPSPLREPSAQESDRTAKVGFPLTVHPVPTDARVRILNIQPSYRPGISLEPGKYHLEVSRPGYQTENRWVTVQNGMVEIPIALVPKQANGTVRHTASKLPPTQTTTPVESHKAAAVVAQPISVEEGKPSVLKPQEVLLPLTIFPEPADAHVQIMNIIPRYQPGMRLKPGTYTIKVSHPDFPPKRFKMVLNTESIETRVVLAKAEKTQKSGKIVAGPQPRVLCDLTDEYTLPLPRHHILTVQSAPGDAQVRILNIRPRYRHGMSLPAGFYHMQVSKEAFETKQCWAEVKDADLLLDIPLKPLAPGDLFALTIKPQPADAHVKLLYTDIPYRPGVLLTPGSYQVEVSRKGYKTEKIPLTLQRENREISVVLKELTLNARPTLTVVPVLKKASIRIINATVPYRPGLPMVPGKYLVEVAKPGFKTQRRWVELSEQDLKIEIEMEDLDTK